MHITKSAEKITPFGGINFCLNSYHHSGLAALIDRYLGPRGQTAGFSFSDILANQMAIYFADGDCAEDLCESLSYNPVLNVCSLDTILRAIKEPRCDSEPLVNPTSGVAHTINLKEPFNELLVKGKHCAKPISCPMRPAMIWTLTIR